MEKVQSKGNLSEKERNDAIQVVLMLYDGAINFLNKAIAFAGEEGNTKKRNHYIKKANQIIVGLDDSLDSKAGGEMAKNLKMLYAFMNRHLIDAAFNDNTEGVINVVRMMAELREGWQYADEQLSAAAA